MRRRPSIGDSPSKVPSRDERMRVKASLRPANRRTSDGTKGSRVITVPSVRKSVTALSGPMPSPA